MKVEEAIRLVEIAFGYSSAIHDDWKPDDEAEKIAIEAMRKQEPMKPVKEIFGNYDCPVCNAYVEFSGNQSYYKHEYCSSCGQAIDWEVKND